MFAMPIFTKRACARHLLRLALGLAVVMSVPGIARAEMGASASAPIVHDIDDRCDARVRVSKKTPGILLTRLYDRVGEPGPWRLATLASNKSLEDGDSDTFYKADFASLSAGRDSVLAGLDSTDSTGDGGEGTTWCFLDGKLARAYRVIGSATDDAVWKRTDYYGDSNELLTHRSETIDISKSARKKPAWPPGAETIPAYRTPAQLPFYAAYLSARAGKLPRMKGALTSAKAH